MFDNLFPPLISTPGFICNRLEGTIPSTIYEHIDRGIGAGYPPPSMFKLPRSLERNDALAFVSSANCAGAIELKELNTIVFLATAGRLFYLTYGDPCNAGRVYSEAVTFRKEYGFLMNTGRMTAQEIRIFEVMQNYYNAWQAKNYEGRLFPSALAICETPALVSAAAASAMSDDETTTASAMGDDETTTASAISDDEPTTTEVTAFAASVGLFADKRKTLPAVPTGVWTLPCDESPTGVWTSDSGTAYVVRNTMPRIPGDMWESYDSRVVSTKGMNLPSFF